jgi:hypothetical protein
MKKDEKYADSNEFWAQFFPTKKFNQSTRNNYNPTLALAKLKPRVFAHLAKLLDAGYSVI